MIYDCIIVGGGIAGLQAAIQLGRYRHQVLVVDSNQGRSTLCRSYHNLLGWPDGVSGQELRTIGRQQAERLSVSFIDDEIHSATCHNSGFALTGRQGVRYFAKCLLLATGIVDRMPDLPGLVPCLGLSIYVCPDCDGYEITDKRTIVLGSGPVGAQMALTLAYWTQNLMYINHEQVSVDMSLLNQFRQQGIRYIEIPVQKVLERDGMMQGVVLENGSTVDAERGFVAFGGNEIRSSLAKQLGVERLENKHIVVNPRTKMTNVANVWAAGDVVTHSEQVSIAMADGAQAAIWIHKRLLEDL